MAESYRYSAYGKARLFGNDGTEIAVSALGNPYGYTGRRFDPESGLLYYRNRYYSPELGRFLTRDPAGQVDGLNVYAYVRSNPLAFVDPWGLSARHPVPAYAPDSATGAFWGEFTRALIGRSDIEPAPEASTWDQASFVFGKTLIRNTPEAVGSVGQMAWGATEAVLGSGYITGSGGAGVAAGGWALAVDGSSNVAGGGTRYWNLLTGNSRPDADLVGQGFRTAATEVGLPPAAGDIARATASMATLSALQSATYAQQQANLQAALRASTTQSTTQGSKSGTDIVGTSHNELRPTQDTVHPEIVSDYARRLRAGESVSPIEAVRTPKGAYIIDGHHRYVGGKKAGIDVPINVTEGQGPVGMPDWSGVQYERFVPE